MKANELTIKDLMIGDWVMNTHNQKPEQVYEILERMVMLDYNDLYEYDEIEPIPLTTEILEKNGFKPYIPESHLETVYACQDVSKAIADELYALWPYQDGSFYLLLRVDGKDIVRMDVHYTHQLQQALRLCGITREIII